MNIRLSKPAEVSLAYIIQNDKETGERIFAQLKHRLPNDPYPDVNDENDLFHSEIVKALEKEGIEIYRLKSKEFLGYRVFYIVDEEKRLIYILEITRRGEHTYAMGKVPIRTIKGLYIEYYANRN
jgi:mRNA-degrading endonuclease RelE of RelBE toxin-antitoxin system